MFSWQFIKLCFRFRRGRKWGQMGKGGGGRRGDGWGKEGKGVDAEGEWGGSTFQNNPQTAIKNKTFFFSFQNATTASSLATSQICGQPKETFRSCNITTIIIRLPDALYTTDQHKIYAVTLHHATSATKDSPALHHSITLPGLAKTILQGTVNGERRHGRQRKRWEDNIREWTGLEFNKSKRAVKNRENWRKLVVKKK